MLLHRGTHPGEPTRRIAAAGVPERTRIPALVSWLPPAHSLLCPIPEAIQRPRAAFFVAAGGEPTGSGPAEPLSHYCCYPISLLFEFRCGRGRACGSCG